MAAGRRQPRPGDLIAASWEWLAEAGTIRAGSRRARRFGRFGTGSAIRFPVAALFGERYIHIGVGSVIGPYSSLSAGVGPGDVPQGDPAVVIGDHTVIGKGSDIVGQMSVEIGNDVWTGPYVYITDSNHGYEDVTVPPGKQFAAREPVRIGDGAWLGTGVVVLPGASVGRHAVIGARAVVIGDIPDFSVAVGNPARVVRRYLDGEWRSVD
jgi:acetyltransferase-like isoleucine patch superfamily enzyme